MRFDLPKELASIIKVVGVGGGGSNAVNHMFRLGITGVDFVVCNTDRQALEISPVPIKIQLGESLTEGLGAGSLPEVGMKSALESLEAVKECFAKNTKMVFITAGMGGGTGTGGAPIIAQTAKDMGILTVAIVTIPFSFEGKNKRLQAEEGIEQLKKSVDCLLVIANDKLREIYGNLGVKSSFAQADNVLANAAKSIAELISLTKHMNVDFNDVYTAMKDSGVALMGTGTASGQDRAMKAVEMALASPLLNDNDITGAKYVLLDITSGKEELTMDELGEITDFIQESTGTVADIKIGYGVDENLGEMVNVTIIATGFQTNPIVGYETMRKPEKKVLKLEDKDVKPEVVEPSFTNTTLVEKKIESSDPLSGPGFSTLSQEEKDKLMEPVLMKKEEDSVVEPEAQNEEVEIPVSEPVTAEAEPEIIEMVQPEESPLVISDETPVMDVSSDEELLSQLESTPVSEVEDSVEELPVSETEETPVSEINITSLSEMSTPEEVTEFSGASDTVVSETSDTEDLFSNENPVAEIESSEWENSGFPEMESSDELPVAEDAFVTEPTGETREVEINVTGINAETSPVLPESNLEELENQPVMESPSEEPVSKAEEPVESEEPVLISKTEENPVSEEQQIVSEEQKRKAQERISKLKELSIKLKSPSGLAELENEPAYVRKGVVLDQKPHSSESNVSRYTLSEGDDKKAEIKPNNSFLHDNVD
jgi:cell division protein FtsZ